MRDNTNQPAPERQQEQTANGQGQQARETTSGDRPGDRLNDGTNDLKNGDQDESSASSSKPADKQ